MFFKKIKKKIVFLMSAVMICIPLQSVFAVESDNSFSNTDNSFENSSEESINNELTELEKQYGGKFIVGDEFSQEFSQNEIKLEFDSVKEFEELLKEFQKQNAATENQNIKIDDASTYATGFKTLKYNAGDWGHLYWRSLDFNYETKVVNGKTQLVRVYNRRSYPQGLTVAFWKEKWHSTPVYNSSRTKVSMKVDGEWRLTVSVGGNPVGYIQPSTWNFSYSI